MIDFVEGTLAYLDTDFVVVEAGGSVTACFVQTPIILFGSRGRGPSFTPIIMFVRMPSCCTAFLRGRNGTCSASCWMSPGSVPRAALRFWPQRLLNKSSWQSNRKMSLI